MTKAPRGLLRAAGRIEPVYRRPRESPLRGA